MFTTTLIALSWHRPSIDFLSLRSRPASLSSRIYFSFALCFELFVSRPPSLSRNLLIDLSGIHIFFLHPPPSPRASRTPDRSIRLPFQHPKRKHLFTTLTFSPTFIPRSHPLYHHRHHNRHPTLSRSTRTT